jgi:hypothetical protein
VQRALVRIVVGLALLLAVTAVGLSISSHLWTDRLRLEAERRMSDLIGGPVLIGDIGATLGLGVTIEVRNLQVWPSAEGASLRVSRVVARVGLLSLLTGGLRASRMVLEGARLRVERGPDGVWRPATLALSAGGPPRTPQHDAMLRPVAALEGAARSLLAKPLLANALELRDAEIVFVDAGGEDGQREAPAALLLKGIHGRIRHRRLLGDAQLNLRARLFDASGERGGLAWEGSRTRGGAIRIAMAASSLDLAIAEPYLRALHPHLRIEGTASGTVALKSSEPGWDRLEIDLALEGLETQVPPPSLGAFGPIQIARGNAAAALEIAPERVRLESLRIEGADLQLEAEGTVVRPLEPQSLVQLSSALREVDLAAARNLLAWLPQVGAERLAASLAPLSAGRLVTLSVRAAAPLTEWRELLAGRTLTLPMGFEGSADLADLVVRVGEESQLEGLRGRVAWSGDRIDVRGARADLDGKPLPELDLTLEGVSNLFAAGTRRRQSAPGAARLRGLRPLWEALRSGEGGGAQTAIELQIDSLEHPIFWWPIENLHAVIEPAEEGLHFVVSEGTWAGVPVRGDADWLFAPNEACHVRLTASPPPPVAAPVPSPGEDASSPPLQPWARGSFSAGAAHGRRWRQAQAFGQFTADDGAIDLFDVEVDLEPSGQLLAWSRLDLSQPDAVPFQLSLALSGGDVAALLEQLGLPPDAATGSVEISGSLQGSLRPEESPFAELWGEISVDATGGEIRSAIPPFAAIALASNAFNPFASRDAIRYSRVAAVFEFSDGVMRTDAFSLDGPDVRALASGEVEVAHPPNEIQGEVALFLFRQLDRALEKIPLLNLLLLGTDENLMAAYYELSGPWEEPRAKLIPLRTLATGPGSLVLQDLPKLVLKGVRWILRPDRRREPKPPAPRPPDNGLLLRGFPAKPGAS